MSAKANGVRGTSKTTAISNSKPEGIQKKLLSKKELAFVLGVSPRTIETWLAERRIPQLRFSARLTRFSLPKVEQALGRYEVKEIGGRW